ncbi:MAG: sensor histidine kinase, partial [Verrucomicrobia bacterium]|nr:sensor histidine kinase [Verrucomicrobiota bacterium]
LPLALLGARVQARGVVGFIANKERQMTGIRLYVPNLAQVEVEKPPEDIFLKPIREVASLLQFHPTADDDLVRLAGVVTLALPGQGFYLRDRTGSLWVQSQQETKLNSGDVVDVVGFPASLPVKPGLADAVFRLTGKQESPAPVRLTNSLQLEDKLKDELVSLDAVVVESQGGKTGTRLVLQSAERLIQCRLVGGHSQELLPERGSVVRVNGVYVAGGLEVLGADTQLPTLLLNTPDELELLSAPPWLTPARLRLTLGIFTLVSSLSVVVIALMRHQIRRQTKAISQHIEQAAVQTERTRIARDWHDTLGQQLVGLGLQLDTARLLAERQPENAVPALNVAVAMLRHSHEEARHSIWHLHASELEQVGLADVLRRLAQESTPAEGKPNVILEIRGQILKLPLAVESHLLRIVQEAVSNALRHAHAAHITMSLEYAPDRVRLRVGDDGCGIPEAACASQGIGLLSMRQRAIKAGGLFLFNSKPGGGTEVIVEIPRAEFPNPPN